MVALRSAGVLGRIGLMVPPRLRSLGLGNRALAADVGTDSPPLRPRRTISGFVLHAPQMLRALVRTDEIWLSVLAAFIGVIAGFCVTGMTLSTQWVHRILFHLGPHERLSGQAEVEPLRAVLGPTLGGLAVGLLAIAVLKWWPRRAVDPIEANALYGGRMSLNDSLVVVAQTMLSNSVGASVGLEAGYTQIGAALASRLGRMFRVRRNDLRLLVGCGAAGAIAAAFNAPLTGAFYAFELVIGTYSLATLAPVVVAAISAVSIVRLLIPDEYVLDVRVPTGIEPSAYAPILAMGIICALGGILIMRGVTLTESLFNRSRVPLWLRPAIGGLVVGVLALMSPQVLSSGHAALQVSLDAPYSLSHIAVLILLKAVASAVSLGSGFRGGLFFASLFLGALLGKLFAAALAALTVVPAIPTVVCALVGMSALAVAVVGGPLTMAFLALEATGSLPLTVAVAADLWLVLRHLALPFARRGHSQRGGYWLGAHADRGPDDATGNPHLARRYHPGRLPPRYRAGCHDPGGGAGCRGPLRRHCSRARSPCRRYACQDVAGPAAQRRRRAAAANDDQGRGADV